MAKIPEKDKIAEMINGIGAMAELSAMIMKLYTQSGFTREEAMRIVEITYQTTLCSAFEKKEESND